MQNRIDVARAAPPNNTSSDLALLKDNTSDISLQQSDIQELQTNNSNSLNTNYDNYQSYSDARVKIQSYFIL